jgi:hypothetical protein
MTIPDTTRHTFLPRAHPEREMRHLVHVMGNTFHLRNELRAWDVYWELIPGCDGWIQAELKTKEVLLLAMAFPDAEIDILE